MYFASNALARKMEKLANESWAKVDLSPSHAYLLMVAIEEPGVQPGTLAGELQLKPSTITRLIEKLEEKKLVVRVAEGKTTNVYATPKGRELLPMLKECLADFYQGYSHILGLEESARLVMNMNKLSDALPG
jgi:DNA-binding MarR family transcriptional regulator